MSKKQLFSLAGFFIITVAFFGLFYSIQTVSAVGITVNGNKASTKIRKVVLSIVPPADARRMMISNRSDFADGSWERVSNEKIWYLDYGRGAKSVYIQFKLNNGTTTALSIDSIMLEPPAFGADFVLNHGQTVSNSRYVSLVSSVTDGVDSFRISHDKNFTGAEWQIINPELQWILPIKAGKYTVFVEYKDSSGDTKVVKKPIEYKPEANRIFEGSLVKGIISPTIYYYGFDGKMYPFRSGEVYSSWFLDYKNIVTVSDSKVRQYPVGDPMCLRPGSSLIKFPYSPTVYAIEPACVLKPIRSEVEAFVLYGKNWERRIVNLGDSDELYYKIKKFDITDTAKGIVDKDGDGLSVDTENDNGSSDNLFDTDSDGLSDYEEIKYWFTNPSNPDSDADGYSDGQEIIKGYSPIGSEPISELPPSSYVHPAGTIVFDPEGKGGLYYISAVDSRQYISALSGDANFINNNFRNKFIVYPRYTMKFPSKRGNLGKASTVVTRPKTMDVKGKLIDL